MKLALIGCGVWGQVILRDLLSLGLEVVVVDPVEDQREVALAKGAGEVVDDLHVLPDVDGVIVATPATTHADVIGRLDELGSTVPIFCEKPLADSSENAQRLLQRNEPRQNGSEIFVMHIWRYHAGVRKLKELYQQGVIGDLVQLSSVRANWTSPRQDVDSLSNLAPHDLSIFQFILGELPEPTYALAEKVNGKLVGCSAVFKSPDPGGVNCLFEISNRYAEKRREVRLHGTKGVLVLPDDSSGIVQHVKEGGYIVADEVEEHYYGKESALLTELTAFVQAIKSDEYGKLCPVEEGAEIVFAIDRIRTLL